MYGLIAFAASLYTFSDPLLLIAFAIGPADNKPFKAVSEFGYAQIASTSVLSIIFKPHSSIIVSNNLLFESANGPPAPVGGGGSKLPITFRKEAVSQSSLFPQIIITNFPTSFKVGLHSRIAFLTDSAYCIELKAQTISKVVSLKRSSSISTVWNAIDGFRFFACSINRLLASIPTT